MTPERIAALRAITPTTPNAPPFRATDILTECLDEIERLQATIADHFGALS